MKLTSKLLKTNQQSKRKLAEARLAIMELTKKDPAGDKVVSAGGRTPKTPVRDIVIYHLAASRKRAPGRRARGRRQTRGRPQGLCPPWPKSARARGRRRCRGARRRAAGRRSRSPPPAWTRSGSAPPPAPAAWSRPCLRAAAAPAAARPPRSCPCGGACTWYTQKSQTAKVHKVSRSTMQQTSTRLNTSSRGCRLYEKTDVALELEAKAGASMRAGVI
eukprot:924230-Prorocentrum_minimum.AAC.7